MQGNEQYYAYANANGGYYYRDSFGKRIGPVNAFFTGLPSVWNRYVFVLVMALVPLLLFGPAVFKVIRRLVLCYGKPTRLRLHIPRKGICLLVAFVMLLGPEHFHSLAQAQVEYANLNTATWANGDTTIEYTYDANGSVETKTTKVTSTQVVNEAVVNNYNLANRLETVTTTRDDTVEVVEYTYNDDGIRVKSEFIRTVSSITDQTRITTYLIDPYNHTGYSQTLEEETITTDYVGGVPQTPVTETTTYLIGDDVIAQTKDGTTQYLLYDGHGSTRQLAEYDTEVTIVNTFSYDAYGVLLQDDTTASADPGKVAQQQTNLLYAGEHFDVDSQNYYLRARWYNSSNGRFNRTDPFSGNLSDPQSLHKYLYCHANPINAIDPSGKFGFFMNVTLLMSSFFFESIINIYQGIQIVDAATILSGVPLSFETISDLARLWTAMVIQLSTRQMSNISRVTRVVFEMAVMYIIDMAMLALTAGLELASIQLSMPSGASGGSRTVRIAAKASKGAQKHHLLSEKILRALNSHPRLSGVFRKADPKLVFRAASKTAHKGYELWHRAVDDVIVNWITNNPHKGKKEFIDFLRKVYQNKEISARIPKVFLWNL